MPKRMSSEQHEHVHQLVYLLQTLMEPKYEKGALEHGGNIWDLTDQELEAAELEEMIDLLVYRLTRLLKRRDASDG
jgi:hypothetical protein